jgi:hypothetical protein
VPVIVTDVIAAVFGVGSSPPPEPLSQLTNAVAAITSAIPMMRHLKMLDFVFMKIPPKNDVSQPRAGCRPVSRTYHKKTG